MSRGGYTHRVVFSSPTPTTDGAGQKALTYTTEFAMRCDALILSSRKGQEYEQVQSGSDVVQFYMPYNDKIKVDWRATWNGSDWDVRTVRDLDGRRRILEVTAERFGQ